ncbi:MAG TPA: CPBP family intramembrane metalloprotease [Candidatus Woesebacteria bacterium]|nr:CPBP family intramembrane metalloprotease [Candidatus Woesebacteria bacterium]
MKQHAGILLRILGYYSLYVLLANIGILVVLVLLEQIGISKLPSITGEFISDVLLLPILIIVFKLYKKEQLHELFQAPLQWKKVLQLFPISIFARFLLVLVIGILAIILVVILNQDLIELINSGVEYQWSLFDESEGIIKLLGFFSFVIFGPINEELLNRVVVLGYLRKFYSEKTSIIYSSIIFALAHVHPGLYLSSFVLGVVLAWIYIKWKNLWYPIILHMLINVQPFILAYFIK